MYGGRRKKMTDLKKLVSLFVVLSFVVVGLASGGNLHAINKTEKVLKDKDKAGLININTAGADELKKLPRIGEKMSQRIIEYRKKNGKFKRIEDIMKVKGIGEKTFKGFEKMITI
jgi:competence protein ComEA